MGLELEALIRMSLDKYMCTLFSWHLKKTSLQICPFQHFRKTHRHEDEQNQAGSKYCWFQGLVTTTLVFSDLPDLP